MMHNQFTQRLEQTGWAKNKSASTTPPGLAASPLDQIHTCILLAGPTKPYAKFH